MPAWGFLGFGRPRIEHANVMTNSALNPQGSCFLIEMAHRYLTHVSEREPRSRHGSALVNGTCDTGGSLSDSFMLTSPWLGIGTVSREQSL